MSTALVFLAGCSGGTAPDVPSQTLFRTTLEGLGYTIEGCGGGPEQTGGALVTIRGRPVTSIQPAWCNVSRDGVIIGIGADRERPATGRFDRRTARRRLSAWAVDVPGCLSLVADLRFGHGATFTAEELEAALVLRGWTQAACRVVAGSEDARALDCEAEKGDGAAASRVDLLVSIHPPIADLESKREVDIDVYVAGPTGSAQCTWDDTAAATALIDAFVEALPAEL